MDPVPLVLTVLLALFFSYTNGFHDASNAVATSISTRALTPRIAVALAAVANLIGAFFGSRVTETVSLGIMDAGHVGLSLVAAALIGATLWNLLTWWFGLPTSSSQALIGGLVGAALVSTTPIHWAVVLERVLLPMLISPLAGLVLGWLLMMAILWAFRRRSPGEMSRGFRYAQTLSATAVAFGHGMQDAAKVAGVIVLALIASGHHAAVGPSAPVWVVVASAVVMSLGTYAGGWRIMRTLGRGIVPLTPPQGFAAETGAAITLAIATALHAPVSTTHAITAAIVGAASTRHARRVRWAVGRDIVVVWIATMPGAAVAAAVAAAILGLVA